MTDPTFFNLILDINGIERYSSEYYEIHAAFLNNDTFQYNIWSGKYVNLSKARRNGAI